MFLMWRLFLDPHVTMIHSNQGFLFEICRWIRATYLKLTPRWKWMQLKPSTSFTLKGYSSLWIKLIWMFTGMKLTWFFIAWMLARSGPARKVFSFWRGSLPTTVVCWSMVVTFKATKYPLSIHTITNSKMVGYNATIMLQLHLLVYNGIILQCIY